MSNLRGYGGTRPSVHADAFVADNATVVGTVSIAAQASIWFNAVLRGDVEPISIGQATNIQDGAILHSDPGAPLRIGASVTVGHGAVLHGCTVGDGALIGIRAVVLDHADVGKHCLIGANALVTSGQKIPDFSLALGSPARVVRRLTEGELQAMTDGVKHYVDSSVLYREEAGESEPPRTRSTAVEA